MIDTKSDQTIREYIKYSLAYLIDFFSHNSFFEYNESV